MQRKLYFLHLNFVAVPCIVYRFVCIVWRRLLRRQTKLTNKTQSKRTTISMFQTWRRKVISWGNNSMVFFIEVVDCVRAWVCVCVCDGSTVLYRQCLRIECGALIFVICRFTFTAFANVSLKLLRWILRNFPGTSPQPLFEVIENDLGPT